MDETKRKPVTVYTTKVCPYCTSAKRLLEERGVPFEEVDLTGKPDLRQEISTKTGMRTVPMIIIGEECIGGYTELAALDRSGGLNEKLAE